MIWCMSQNSVGMNKKLWKPFSSKGIWNLDLLLYAYILKQFGNVGEQTNNGGIDDLRCVSQHCW